MRYPLVGIGAAGIVSTVAFTLFLPSKASSFDFMDLVNTSVLLGLTFGAILAVGLATMAKTIHTRRHGVVKTSTIWSMKCPRCGFFIRRRTHFCPHCAEDLR